jgi:hypothetical protein
MAFRRSGVRFPSAPLQQLPARVAELVDAQDSGSCGGNPVRVRVPPRACGNAGARPGPVVGARAIHVVQAHVLELVDRLV